MALAWNLPRVNSALLVVYIATSAYIIIYRVVILNFII
jgi:hypothetical protein